MTGGGKRKVSAASASGGVHTRMKSKQSNSLRLSLGVFGKLLGLLLLGISAWFYQLIQPPPPKICGSPGGPPITAPRIKLRDGRHLAYKEHGVPKDKAKYKIVSVHGFDSCRHDTAAARALSPELFEGLGIYIVSFDRPGYGESDPNPKRTVKSAAMDIEELVDQLALGTKFYVIGGSMGGLIVWSCLKYIPNRLAGAVLIAPVINYWWSGLPANLSNEAFKWKPLQDQWALSVAHYTPWLTYWWNTQKWFPASSIIAHNPDVLSPADKNLIPKLSFRHEYTAQIRQQGEYESLHQDLNVGFSSWEFSPLELKNPFPHNNGSIHIWQGDDDRVVSPKLQRYIAEKLPWIRYHEVSGAGHLFSYADNVYDSVITALLLEEK
ncbi:hydrolase family protein [Cucumis melo var. makuwa]|uniref:Hydrolase family protein n=1 Tax=Cucumis melo var. makuwa TaxID=1194695 RepID=A0A5A7TRQ5_CUCMM|nr:hydrolase family protein [Cucumis melo var. makuwa]TYK25248.1 hydrolase family protein [Cucumis melo var. makuwa]